MEADVVVERYAPDQPLEREPLAPDAPLGHEVQGAVGQDVQIVTPEFEADDDRIRGEPEQLAARLVSPLLVGLEHINGLAPTDE